MDDVFPDFVLPYPASGFVPMAKVHSDVDTDGVAPIIDSDNVTILNDNNDVPISDTSLLSPDNIATDPVPSTSLQASDSGNDSSPHETADTRPLRRSTRHHRPPGFLQEYHCNLIH